MRYTHILRPNKTSETPQRVLFVMVAKRREKGRGTVTEYSLACGVALHCVRTPNKTQWRERLYQFTTKAQFWRILDQITPDKTRTYICVDDTVHTLALLDVFTTGYNRGWIWTQIVIGCPPTIIRGRRENASIVFLERLNIWPPPSTGCLDGVSDKNSSEKQDAVCFESDDARLQRDVQTISRLWRDWWDFLVKNDLGGFAPTIGSQAVRTYRHRWMTHQILIDNNWDALKLAREAYKGGRAECFYVGRCRGNYYLLDVNSMYAEVMRRMDVPVRLISYTENASLKDVRRWMVHRAVIADVTIQTAQPMFGMREGGKLLFPVGRLRACLAGSEVERAAEMDCITDVHKVATYEKQSAFKQFCEEIYSYRQCCEDSGDYEGVEKWKMMLRSFYGKWGQHGGVWEKYEDADDDSIRTWVNVDFDTKVIDEYRQFGGVVQKLSHEEESATSSPAIAACITAGGRMMLWDLITTAGRENVLYVDTDSLLVNNAGFDALRSSIEPGRLGGLRLVGTYHDVELRGPKDYTFDCRRRIKGVSEGALAIGSHDFAQTQRDGFASMMRAGDLAHARERRIRKHISGAYDKGVVLPDGKVVPYERG